MPPWARSLTLFAALAAAVAILGASARGAAPTWMAVLPEVGGKKGDGPVAVPHCRRARPRCIGFQIQRTDRLRERLGCDHEAVFATSSLLLARTLRDTVRSQPGLFRFPKYLFRQQALSSEVYFDTRRAWHRGKPVAPAWQIAFEAARGRELSSLQDMLLGINAQVQNDLPFVIAALGVKGRGGRSRKPDHRVLSSIVNRAYGPMVEAIARRYEPRVSDPGWSPIEGVTGPELVESWQRAAWRNAKRLLKVNGAVRRQRVSERIATGAAESAMTIATPEVAGHRAVRNAYCTARLPPDSEDPGGSQGSEDSAKTHNSADELIFWTGCDQLTSLSNAELDAWKAKGVDGFVCMVEHLRGMGGDQDFTGEPNADLGGSNYALQRSLRDSRIVERAAAQGIRLYLGAYYVNHFNKATPLAEWFDDSRWTDVLSRIREHAAAARQLGFAGVAVNQELYRQADGADTATWNWNYPGNTHTEAEVRAQARERGQQVMAAILEGFPNVDLPIFHVHMPGMWGELVVEEVRGKPNAYADRLDVDFLAGMLSVEGYGTVRILNGILQKTPHITDDWDTAMQYESNQVMALLSREVENWEYASSRLYWMPFSWLDDGPREFDDPKPAAYVQRQLQAMRKWGMGRMFANFVYGGLHAADYTPYLGALRNASSPTRVDAEDPTVKLASTDPPVIEGTADDNLGIRAVRWRDERGGSGVAQLTWEVLAGDADAGYQWQMRWAVPATEISPGSTRVIVVAEDLKGEFSAPVSFRWP